MSTLHSAIAAIAFNRTRTLATLDRILQEKDPPRVLVAYDRVALDIEDVARLLADALNAFGDSLYERELEIVYR